MKEELLNRIRAAYESESPSLGSLLKEAGFNDDQLNSLRSAYENNDDNAFGSVIKAGPTASAPQKPDSFPQADWDRIQEVGREQWAAEQNVARDKQIVSDRTAAVKEENPVLSAMFPRTADEIGSGEIEAGMDYQNPANSISKKAAIDVGTLPGRAYVAATDMLPGEDGTFLESMAKTEANPDLHWSRRIPEQILRDDPTTFVPGATVAKGASKLGKVFQYGTPVAEQLLLEGGRQGLEEKLDVGNLMMAGGIPTVLEGGSAMLRGGAKKALNTRLGQKADADMLLDEGLVPFSVGSGDEKIGQAVQTKLQGEMSNRTADIASQDQLRQDAIAEVMASEAAYPQQIQDATFDALAGRNGPDGTPIADAIHTRFDNLDAGKTKYDAASINLDEASTNAIGELAELRSSGALNQKEVKAANDIILAEKADLAEFASDDILGSGASVSKSPVSNRAERWLSKSGANVPTAKKTPSQIAYSLLLKQANSQLPGSGKIKRLQEIGEMVQKKIDQPNSGASWESMIAGLMGSNAAVNIADKSSKVLPSIVDRRGVGGIMMATAKETEDELNQ